MFMSRCITAIIAILLVWCFIYIGDIRVLACVMLGLSCIAAYEWLQLVPAHGKTAYLSCLIAWGIGIVATIFGAPYAIYIDLSVCALLALAILDFPFSAILGISLAPMDIRHGIMARVCI